MGSKRMVGAIIRTGSRPSLLNSYLMFSRSKPSLWHALVVIFLEFFSWGLLTIASITILNKTFPKNTFLWNGIIMGIKGFLSFLSAPLIGALSDLWGRKFFLLITVFFTCLPIPFLKLYPVLYFILVSMSGFFAVTFSVIFAYVADITEEHERSFAYGWVTATFAFSLITSPALGSYIATYYGTDLVIFFATMVAITDFFYILFFVPESLSEKLRQKSASFWETVDPFGSMRKAAGKDRMILNLCLAVFLSYLPEAGQYSCFFVYLKLVIGFTAQQVSAFIALVGFMSVFAQTMLLSYFIKRFGGKNTIMIGLIFEMLQLICYGLGSNPWVVWSAGILAAGSTITYPAISAYVSNSADADKQGLVQGIITGIRGLCNGLGPCLFGLVFSLFNVDLQSTDEDPETHPIVAPPPIGGNQTGSALINFINSTTNQLFHSPTDQVIPGPPFLFGALLVLLAILVMAFIPELNQYERGEPGPSGSRSSSRLSGSSSMISPSHRASRNQATNTGNYFYKSMHHQLRQEDTGCGQPLGSADDELNDVKLLPPGVINLSSGSEGHFSPADGHSAASLSSSDDEGDSDIDTQRKLMASYHHNNHQHQVLLNRTSVSQEITRLPPGTPPSGALHTRSRSNSSPHQVDLYQWMQPVET